MLRGLALFRIYFSLCTILVMLEKGMKGLSVLFRHPCFDVSKGVVVDALHGLYLGVVHSLLSLWFD